MVVCRLNSFELNKTPSCALRILVTGRKMPRIPNSLAESICLMEQRDSVARAHRHSIMQKSGIFVNVLLL